MRAPFLHLFLASALLCGCDPFAFDDIADHAPIVVLEAPDDYPRDGFGSVLGVVAGDRDGMTVTDLAVGGGADTPVHVYSAWTGTKVNLAGGSRDELCDDPGECSPGFGEAVTGSLRWRDERLCFLVTAPPLRHVQVHCSTSNRTWEDLTGPAGEDTGFGVEITAMPPGSPVGIALIGAPLTLARTGQVIRMTDGGAPVEVVDFGAAVPAAGELGRVIAAADLGAGDTLLALAAPHASPARVIVATQRAGATTPTVTACLDSSDAGFGGALAFGDFDGDGTPDLVVGVDRAAAARVESVRIYDGAALVAGTGCTDQSAVGIGCPDVAAGAADVTCTASAFGAALAAGDIDADGDDELIVGAPEAAVAGKQQAGAVFVLDGDTIAAFGSTARALVHSAPSGMDALGSSVITFPTAGTPVRHEIVAGSPGSDEALVFLCSGLPGDDPAVGAQCQP